MESLSLGRVGVEGGIFSIRLATRGVGEGGGGVVDGEDRSGEYMPSAADHLGDHTGRNFAYGVPQSTPA